jgi:glycosyltransferase involved in cell wall biosynthesis
MKPKYPEVSIIIPALAANDMLTTVIKSILNNLGPHMAEIIIVNDGLDNKMRMLESKFPIKVVDGNRRGAAAARNIGVQSSNGRYIIFVDSDCRVSSDWLAAHLKTHEQYKGLTAVGGSVCLEPRASFWALCDHYCSWYNIHPYQKGHWVPNQPSANLSMSRKTMKRVGPFNESLPTSGGHEDIEWQKRLIALGGRIFFKPEAMIWHMDRSDLKGYLTHHYLWGYNSIEVKGRSSATRFPFIYKNPLLLIIGFFPFAIAHTFYIIIRWLKAGKLKPLLFCVFLFMSRLCYALGMVVGGIRYLNRRNWTIWVGNAR